MIQNEIGRTEREINILSLTVIRPVTVHTKSSLKWLNIRKELKSTKTRNFDLKEQCHEIFDFLFFYESVSPKPLSIPLGPATGINNTSETGGKIDTGGAPWLAKISANFRKKFETVLMGYSGALI